MKSALAPESIRQLIVILVEEEQGMIRSGWCKVEDRIDGRVVEIELNLILVRVERVEINDDVEGGGVTLQLVRHCNVIVDFLNR